jgi:tetratricopeptide (TPR) repeat protein
LDWLDLVLQDKQVDAQLILERMNQKAAEFREQILAEALLQQQDQALQVMLARGLVFELPVPSRVMAALWTEIPGWEHQRDRATALGLLEQTPSPEEVSYRVPRILSPLLPPVVDEHLYVTATEALYQQWWQPSAGTTEEQALEIYRLARLAQADAIVDKVGTALAIDGRSRDATESLGDGCGKQLVELRQRLLGADHPAVATSLHNLACSTTRRGATSRQNPSTSKPWSYSQRLLGEDHPDVAASLNNLAGLYRAQGRYEQAEPLCLQALELNQRLLGRDHPDVAAASTTGSALPVAGALRAGRNPSSSKP